jgi:hypothetical protein
MLNTMDKRAYEKLITKKAHRIETLEDELSKQRRDFNELKT